MGDTGAGSPGAGIVGIVGVYGLVLVLVMSGLSWTQEVACPQASGTAFCGNDSAFLSRDSGHVLVKRREKLSCWRVGRG